MRRQYSSIAGFMSAESIYSLAFYIVMVAAIAGVGAGIMSKHAAAKGVSALSVLRANYQAEVSLLGYGANPTPPELEKLSTGLLTADAAPATTASLAGVGTFSIVNQPTLATRSFAINIVGVQNRDVCMALASTGFGSWVAMGVMSAPVSATGSIPSTPGSISSGGTVAPGVLATKVLAKAQCSNIAAAPVTTVLAFISN